MDHTSDLPVAVIGAGPVGLAAAAHLLQRGLQPVVFERGEGPGSSLIEWGHVRVFSPWQYVLDKAAQALLEDSGWTQPDPDALPTGAEIVEHYLAPLARLPNVARHIKYNASVNSITRLGLDKVASEGRDDTPFVVRYTVDGVERKLMARAVLDASGTWLRPNPIGIDGLPVVGEKTEMDRIRYGIPDVSGREKKDYADRRILVIGGGHSAINVVLALLDLQRESSDTSIIWALRRNKIAKLLGGGLNDQLPARGALGLAAKDAIESGRLKLLAPFSVESILPETDALRVNAQVAGSLEVLDVDRIIVATGFRPDLEILSELRIDLDAAVESPRQLAPMIDPNLHSCGTVPPHGVDELSHSERDFYIVGSKSYGRAPTFLMATGYEQVRSVVAELAGDPVAARQVQLVLPETGVCNVTLPGDRQEAEAGCCGGPAPVEADACCVADATAKSEGKSGCGCGSPAQPKEMETVG
ncbi:FAD-dependent oxidoreductase [Ensifer adhaerens]|uniref:FAD-dependent oxidoreductase n=1 Tax=Ensifer adhaerens TaxID=106592 RepID=UPI001C4E0471|nr:FAD-dependent oxidoreductase [Ensifer adhaerens]MBW0368301.1 NAD(P)-binding domain-containing protein [Ensifer adhaerens]UCM24957.1 NAD(P)-binding domain-containing protein [Ensifer adhaerens]